jgi:hypothetical protein
MRTETGHSDGPLLHALLANWQLKAWLSVIMSAGFWTAYLCAQRFPLGMPRPAPSLALDAMIPFLPGTVVLYESLWVLQAIAPWLMQDRRELLIYCRTLGIMMIVALTIFILWPTASPRPADTASANALYRALIRVDLDLNAFPSLHAAFTVYSALGCRSLFRRMRAPPAALALVWAWMAGILAATLLTKQHTILDVVAGVALGSAFHALYLRGARR